MEKEITREQAIAIYRNLTGHAAHEGTESFDAGIVDAIIRLAPLILQIIEAFSKRDSRTPRMET